MFAAALAHQGGWDEGLLVAAPLLILAAIMRMAKKRADRLVPLDDPSPPAEVDPNAGDEPDLSPDAPPTRPTP